MGCVIEVYVTVYEMCSKDRCKVPYRLSGILYCFRSMSADARSLRVISLMWRIVRVCRTCIIGIGRWRFVRARQTWDEATHQKKKTMRLVSLSFDQQNHVSPL